VLVTRPQGRGERLVRLLGAAGLSAEHAPLTRLVPLGGEEPEAARALLAQGAFTHLVLTSRTAVECLGEVEVPAATEIVAVGEGTAAARGLTASLVAGGSGAELVTAMPRAEEGARVLLPGSASAARTVPEGLRAKGYRVQEVATYRHEGLDPSPTVSVALAAGGFGAVVLTSPVIARRAAGLGIHPSTAVITIGEPTSAAARAAGLSPTRQAASPSDEALVEAVLTVLTPSSDGVPTPPVGGMPPRPAPGANPAVPPKETR
jgi:uroporphyrinogen-III synthase